MRILGLIIALGLIFLATWQGSSLSYFVDLPSILILAGGTLGMYLFSGTSVGLLFRSLSPGGLTGAELAEAATAWKRLRQFATAAAWISFLIGLIAMLQWMVDYDSFAPGLATALIVPFYSAVLSYAVCLPIQRHLEDTAG